MIDMHAHFLPGVDDGAADMAEAQAMLEMAAAAGTRVLVATPHSDMRYQMDPELCRSSLEQLSELAPAGLRLRSGCEVHLTPENVDRVLRRPSAYSLGGGDCILLELPADFLPPVVQPATETLTARGLRIVIAHPERNRYIQQRPGFAERLVEWGCYLQVTAGSLTGSFGPAAEAAAGHLLQKRLVHFVASDGHGAERRRPLLRGAYRKVEIQYGARAAELLFRANPEAALNSSAIEHMRAGSGWLSGILRRTFHGTRKQHVPIEMS